MRPRLLHAWRAAWTHRHLWIGLALLLANGFAWSNTTLQSLPQVEPRLAPEIADLRTELFSGEAHGKTFQLVISDQTASEAVAWFLARHSEVPFSHPQVQFTPEGITGSGIAHILGLRAPVYGRIGVSLREGLPYIQLYEISVSWASAPAVVLSAIENELDRQAQAVRRLPFTLTRLEFVDGEMLIEGAIR